MNGHCNYQYHHQWYTFEMFDWNNGAFQAQSDNGTTAFWDWNPSYPVASARTVVTATAIRLRWIALCVWQPLHVTWAQLYSLVAIHIQHYNDLCLNKVKSYSRSMKLTQCFAFLSKDPKYTVNDSKPRLDSFSDVFGDWQMCFRSITAIFWLECCSNPVIIQYSSVIFLKISKDFSSSLSFPLWWGN